MEAVTSSRTHSRRTLIEEINHLSAVYGLRNKVYLNGFSDRTNYLLVAVKDLFEVVRKDHSPILQQVAVARVFSRLVCVIEYFRINEVYAPFVTLLCSKYPLAGCSYCKQKPCKCPPGHRPESSLDDSNLNIQKKWTIHQWQSHLASVYSSINNDSNWDRMYVHMITEVVEIINVNQSTHSMNQDEILNLYSKELADTFAWLCGVCTKMSVQLGASVELLYGQGCGSCKALPCNCGPMHFDFLDWKVLEDKYQDYPLSGSSDDLVSSRT